MSAENENLFAHRSTSDTVWVAKDEEASDMGL